jgi:hypothetical protein
MAIALQLRKLVLFLLWFSLFTLIVVIVSSDREYNGYAQPPVDALVAQEAPGCPGVRMNVQATGEYRGAVLDNGQYRDGSQLVHVNGEPWGGADWAPGDRSYWHCHRGGQLLVMWEGEGRMQDRGQRVRILRRGEMSYAAPWQEHWHGAGPNEHGHWLQSSLQPTGTHWMEEVSDDDFLGNDIGINSRNEFLATGVTEKYPNR